MKKWLKLAPLVAFFLFCFAVGLLTIASAVRTKIKALRLRWLYGKALSRLDDSEQK